VLTLATSPSPSETTGMVRVPARQLQQFTSLFADLLLERNAINLRFKQSENYVRRLRERLTQLERSNVQLRNGTIALLWRGLFLPPRQLRPQWQSGR
ncbi:MAG: hypothetical protein HC890_10440, partial [Chloroflexaceae bacterium]|nr:hypothetical protein [Chloroflexaceae bacterium]